MVAVEEQPRKPLCLDSDLGNGQHLPEYALHARPERIQDIRCGTVLPDDRAVQKRVDAKMRVGVEYTPALKACGCGGGGGVNVGSGTARR
jgi:hypothetical protein